MRNEGVRQRSWTVTDIGKNAYRKNKDGEDTKFKCGQVNLAKVGFQLCPNFYGF